MSGGRPHADSPREGEARDLGGPRRPPGPTRREIVAGLRRELEDAGVESPGIEAERLVAHALGIDRTELGLSGGAPVGPAEAGHIARLAARRLAGQPLQHIEGTVEFRGLVLRADARALIPRPETEQLVEEVTRWARTRARVRGGEVSGSRPGHQAESVPPVEAVLDIGTGSGAIALSLVAEGIARRAIGLDVSAAALEQAVENRARVGLDENRVELRLAARPVWTALRPGERFDVIVSNPPYVSDEEFERLPPEVGETEPRVALAGGEDGLDVVREIAAHGRSFLKPGGVLFLEIGAAQGASVTALLEAAGWGSVTVLRDLAGRDRFVRAAS